MDIVDEELDAQNLQAIARVKDDEDDHSVIESAVLKEVVPLRQRGVLH